MIILADILLLKYLFNIKELILIPEMNIYILLLYYYLFSKLA
jgi:hypothetical protein